MLDAQNKSLGITPSKMTVTAVKSDPSVKNRTRTVMLDGGDGYLTPNEKRMYNAFGDVSTFKDYYDKYQNGEFTQEDADNLGILKENAEKAFNSIAEKVLNGEDETKALEDGFISFDVKGIV